VYHTLIASNEETSFGAVIQFLREKQQHNNNQHIKQGQLQQTEHTTFSSIAMEISATNNITQDQQFGSQKYLPFLLEYLYFLRCTNNGVRTKSYAGMHHDNLFLPCVH